MDSNIIIYILFIDAMEIEPIAVFHSPFATKFGVPKQSGLVKELCGTIVFLPKYRSVDALRGMEDFDYLWLVWEFSANKHVAKSPVVRPPLLGGNRKMGVFATRSPFRPNRLGLSSVRISKIDFDASCGPVIHVLGADLMDNTPIYDIKPYLKYADCHPDARSGFVDANDIKRLDVEVAHDVAKKFSKEYIDTLVGVLELDPRPHYQNDPQKVYGMEYDGMDVKFKVSDGVLFVVDMKKKECIK